MKVYYDTEFIEDGRTIDLISIGMVAEDGREYYAVNAAIGSDLSPGGNDKLHDRIRRHHWIMRNVVPHLPLREGRDNGLRLGGEFGPDFWLSRDSVLVKPKWLIANEVRDFLAAAAPVELWAWYGAYDHVCLAQLWGPMVDLPDGVPMWTNDLRQECERLGNPQLPEQTESEHNALADARHLKVRAEYLEALGRGTDV
jgi:hypothetical protein